MNSNTINVVYSYSQKDILHKDKLESSLALLRNSNIIKAWSVREILPGQNISEKSSASLMKADIILFLVSSDFINSDICIEEWNVANTIARNENKKIISIILRDCPWKDFSDMKNYAVLPQNETPIELWSNNDSAWTNIYDGIKSVVESIRNDFTIKDDFLKQVSTMEFCSSSNDSLLIDDIFVFPNVIRKNDLENNELSVKDVNELLKNQCTIIQGDFQSGKTTLAIHTFLENLRSSIHTLYVDLQEISAKKPNEDIFANIYAKQFNGDYDLWKKSKNKVIIFDNLTHQGNAIDHVKFSESLFEKIVVMCSIEEHESYFNDDQRLVDYALFNIRPFTHAKQEKLIRNWLSHKNKSTNEEIELGKVDLIENNINAIIINNRILPRYPFFILSILQTHEAFMPPDVKITAYGHCYYALILAHLIKSGVSKDDSAISSCLNFACHLAFEIFSNNSNSNSLSISNEKYEEFKEKYKNDFIIQDALINRMQSKNGIIKACNGSGFKFSLSYSYYYFLGQYLAAHYKENRSILLGMIENNFKKNNALSIIFTIHHSNEIEIIDEILTYTMCAHDDIQPAKLDDSELKIFNDLLVLIPERIGTAQSVDEVRSQERDRRDNNEEDDHDSKSSIENSDHDNERKQNFNQTFQCYKNIEILSHILKNKFGSLKKDKVSEIVETVCDAGLRLAALLLSKNVNTDDLIDFVYKAYLKSDEFDKTKSKQEQLNEVRRLVVLNIFIWVMMNFEKTVSSINKPDLRTIIDSIREKKNTPAFELLYYFYTLDTATTFENHHKENLKELMDKYQSKEMQFLRRVLSLRTQHYFNTHNVKTPMRQTVSSILGIEFKPKQIEHK